MTTPNTNPENPSFKPASLTRRQFLRKAGIAGVGLTLGARAARALPANGPLAGKPKKKRKEIRNAVPASAIPLPLTDVRLTGGPLKRAQDLDAKYLLDLEPDRMMAFLRERAGLKPKAEGYGGWDGGGRNLTGHIAGHYLSAVSLMYAATGDERFKQRADYLVSEMKTVQDKNGDGYLGALQDGGGTDGKIRFEDIAKGIIRSGGFDLNGLWSPWYVQHKLFAGLRDAYRFTGNETALDVEIAFAGWAEKIVGGLTDEQDQQMLRTEFGGMNEVLADLYADTGDRRWLVLSDRFEHRDVLLPLSRSDDQLGGLHANTQIPKLIGSVARYAYAGDKTDGAAASFFWDTVTAHHTFATGGHGQDEYFGPADKLSAHVDGRTDESCNVYNMLKLTRELFALKPDVKYAEFQERALFNHVVGSMDPEDGRTCYMVPVGRGVRHEYQDMFESFTCCVGTGMENHALHGYGIYYEAGDRLYVNVYAPSKAEWRSAGASLAMETSFPEGDSATLSLTLKKPKKLTLSLRRPSWAGDGFSVSVNGKPVADLPPPGSYVDLARTWKTGDTVTLALPKALHAEPLPDNPNRAALLWGPLVLSGDLGPEEGEQGAPDIPVFVASAGDLASWLHPVDGTPGAFRSAGVGRDSSTGEPRDVDFQPFYRLHRRTYAAYWDLYTPQEWDRKAAEVAAEREKQRRLDAATVGYAQPGEMQPERDYNEQGEDTEPIRVQGRPGRHGRNWFSFDMPVDPAHPMTLIVTYNARQFRACAFDILVGGQKIGSETMDRSPGAEAKFYDTEYAVPAALVAGKQKVTVRFQATGGRDIAAVFGIRTVRADAEK